MPLPLIKMMWTKKATRQRPATTAATNTVRSTFANIRTVQKRTPCRGSREAVRIEPRARRHDRELDRWIGNVVSSSPLPFVHDPDHGHGQGGGDLPQRRLSRDAAAVGQVGGRR